MSAPTLTDIYNLARRLAGSRAANPAQLPALELRDGQLPDVGVESVALLTLGNDETIGGGSVLLRSPYGWATWRISESRDNVGEQEQVGRTGPFCVDAVYVSSAARVSAIVARYWDVTADPLVNPLTGVVTSQTPDPDLEIRPALRAVYLPGVTPAQLRRAAFSLYFAAGLTPADAPAIPISAIPYYMAYPVDFYRKACAHSSLDLGWRVVLPDATGTTATATLVGASGVATATLVGASGVATATLVGAQGTATATLVGPGGGEDIAVTAAVAGLAGNGIAVTTQTGGAEGVVENIGLQTVTITYTALSTTTSLVAAIAGAGLTLITATGAGGTVWSPLQAQTVATAGGTAAQNITITAATAGVAGNAIAVTTVAGGAEAVVENVGLKTVTITYVTGISTTTSLVAAIAGAGLTLITAAGAGLATWGAPQAQTVPTAGGTAAQNIAITAATAGVAGNTIAVTTVAGGAEAVVENVGLKTVTITYISGVSTTTSLVAAIAGAGLTLITAAGAGATAWAGGQAQTVPTAGGTAAQNIAITAVAPGLPGNGIAVTTVAGGALAVVENVGLKTVTITYVSGVSTTTSIVAAITGAGLTLITAAGAGAAPWAGGQAQTVATAGGTWPPQPISDATPTASTEADLCPGQWGVIAATNGNGSASNATILWET
jgi:hypothetical protein